MRKQSIEMIIVGTLNVFFLLFPSPLKAFCLKNCQPEEMIQSGTIHSSSPSINYQQNQADRRVGSHNFGNQSTNVLGDMHIRIGHEKVEISGVDNLTNSVIDTSINPTIVLGNVRQ